MANRITAGFEIYNKSSQLFGMEVVEYDFPLPEMNTITTNVPYHNGEYDFSFIYGGMTYSDRKIVFKTRIYENNWQTRSEILIDVRNWLYGRPKSKMTTEFYDGYSFNAKCISIDYTIKSYCIEFDIEFQADPYMTNVADGEKVI